MKLKAYSITNCSASTARESKFVIKNLSITPDPVLIPGRVKFSFDISVLTDLDNVQVNGFVTKLFNSLNKAGMCLSLSHRQLIYKT